MDIGLFEGLNHVKKFILFFFYSPYYLCKCFCCRSQQMILERGSDLREERKRSRRYHISSPDGGLISATSAGPDTASIFFGKRLVLTNFNVLVLCLRSVFSNLACFMVLIAGYSSGGVQLGIY